MNYIFNMIISIIIANLITILQSQLNNQLTCPVILCSSSTNAVNASCFTNITGSQMTKIVIFTCQTNQFCNLPLPNNLQYTNSPGINCKTVPINYFSGLKPGSLVEYDFCESNTDCASLKCHDNLCVGLELNTPCNSNYACASQLYCDSSKKQCISRKNINTPCTSDIECISGSGCLSGFCTGYYSVKSGINLNSTRISQDMVNYCYSSWANSNGVCEDLLNTGIAPYSCLVKDGCSYKSSITGTTVNLKNCSCDLRGNGHAYCMLGTNTASYYNYIQANLDILNAGCHFYNRFGCSKTDKNIRTNLEYTIANVSQIFIGDYPCLDPINIAVNPANCKSPPCDGSDLIFYYNETSISSYLIVNFFILFSIIIILL